MDKGRFYLVAAGVVFAFFVADVLIAKVQVLSGNTMPVHLGDTLQFIVLLVAVTLFVIGTLARERPDREGDTDSIEPHDPRGPGHSTRRLNIQLPRTHSHREDPP